MQLGPPGEVRHQIADEAARRLVGQIAVGIELVLRLTDQHFARGKDSLDHQAV